MEDEERPNSRASFAIFLTSFCHDVPQDLYRDFQRAMFNVGMSFVSGERNAAPVPPPAQFPPRAAMPPPQFMFPQQHLTRPTGQQSAWLQTQVIQQPQPQGTTSTAATDNGATYQVSIA